MPVSSSSDDPPRLSGDLRSFGRRHGRKLSPRQQTLVEGELPKLRLDLAVPPPDPLGRLFSPPAQDVWLEIGFGGGEHLLWQAAHHPGIGLIGCEPFVDGVVKVLDAVKTQDLANLRLYDDDARAVLRWLEPASLGRVFVLFPDPWPKQRHRKRRLVTTELMGLLARVLRPGGELRMATDIADYAGQMLRAALGSGAFVWQARTMADWRHRPDDWPPTRYEAKARREGRGCCYLRFTRTGAATA